MPAHDTTYVMTFHDYHNVIDIFNIITVMFRLKTCNIVKSLIYHKKCLRNIMSKKTKHKKAKMKKSYICTIRFQNSQERLFIGQPVNDILSGIVPFLPCVYAGVSQSVWLVYCDSDSFISKSNQTAMNHEPLPRIIAEFFSAGHRKRRGPVDIHPTRVSTEQRKEYFLLFLNY